MCTGVFIPLGVGSVQQGQQVVIRSVEYSLYAPGDVSNNKS